MKGRNNLDKFTNRITKISLSGYKCFKEETTVELGKLTIFSGTNSSGKSSFFQPLLLLKQTLEESSDSGLLSLNGGHLQFNNYSQLFTHNIDKTSQNEFNINFEINNRPTISLKYGKIEKELFLVQELHQEKVILRSDMCSEEFINKNKEYAEKRIEKDRKRFTEDDLPCEEFEFVIEREKCFLKFHFDSENYRSSTNSEVNMLKGAILGIIHIPALRGNPRRYYNKNYFAERFVGTFEPYIASIIYRWIETKDKNLSRLYQNLTHLKLTNSITTNQLNDIDIELLVNRLHKANVVQDYVSLADVGFGVSQSIPIIVALIIAKPGQIVYIEQPEIHLHPRAQVRLADLFIEASKRGVRILIETHSDHLILAIRTLVAEEKFDSSGVILHWFSQNSEGYSNIDSSKLDNNGTYGDWPEDFSEVSLNQKIQYMNAIERNN